MKYFAVCLSLLLPHALFAADDCTFSQEHQAKVLKTVAERFTGGVTEAGKRRITWSLPGGGTTTFSYGGCYHLGSFVSQADRSATPRTQEQVFAVARDLAKRFWDRRLIGDSLALDALVTGLDRSEFTIEHVNGKTFFKVRHVAYAELYVEHKIEDGMDSVSIAWQGNF